MHEDSIKKEIDIPAEEDPLKLKSCELDVGAVIKKENPLAELDEITIKEEDLDYDSYLLNDTGKLSPTCDVGESACAIDNSSRTITKSPSLQCNVLYQPIKCELSNSDTGLDALQVL